MDRHRDDSRYLRRDGSSCISAAGRNARRSRSGSDAGSRCCPAGRATAHGLCVQCAQYRQSLAEHLLDRYVDVQPGCRNLSSWTADDGQADGYLLHQLQCQAGQLDRRIYDKAAYGRHCASLACRGEILVARHCRVYGCSQHSQACFVPNGSGHERVDEGPVRRNSQARQYRDEWAQRSRQQLRACCGGCRIDGPCCRKQQGIPVVPVGQELPSDRSHHGYTRNCRMAADSGLQRHGRGCRWTDRVGNELGSVRLVVGQRFQQELLTWSGSTGCDSADFLRGHFRKHHGFNVPTGCCVRHLVAEGQDRQGTYASQSWRRLHHRNKHRYFRRCKCCERTGAQDHRYRSYGYHRVHRLADAPR